MRRRYILLTELLPDSRRNLQISTVFSSHSADINSVKYIISLLCLFVSIPAFSQQAYVGAPTFKLTTRIPAARALEFTRLRVSTPTLEANKTTTLKVYAHDPLKNVFMRTPQVISFINQGDYFHNGVAIRGNDGRQYFQMVQTLPNRQESIVGWVSSEQLINPPQTSGLNASNTFFSTTRCLSCEAANAVQNLSNTVDAYVFPNSGPAVAPATPADPNERPGCPIPEPYTARQTGRRGMRLHPILRINRMHHGSDWAPANPRTPLVSMMSGRVISAGIAGGHGYRVAIQHPDGKISSYSHLQIPFGKPECALPTEGSEIAKGAKLGCMGTTGLSTGVHLHLEIYANRADYDAVPKRSMVQENWVDFRAACGGRFTAR